MSATLILRDQECEVEAGTTIFYALVKLGLVIRVMRPLRDGEFLN